MMTSSSACEDSRYLWSVYLLTALNCSTCSLFLNWLPCFRCLWLGTAIYSEPVRRSSKPFLYPAISLIINSIFYFMSASCVLMCLLIVVTSDEQTPRKTSFFFTDNFGQRPVLNKPSEMTVEDHQLELLWEIFLRLPSVTLFSKSSNVLFQLFLV